MVLGALTSPNDVLLLYVVLLGKATKEKLKVECHVFDSAVHGRSHKDLLFQFDRSVTVMNISGLCVQNKAER